MLTTNIHPINAHNQYSINTYNTNMSDKLANNMPNGFLRVAETQTNRNIENNIKNRNLRQIYAPKLAPSTGSLTESFIKSRSNMSPIYRFNEAATKYQMTSVAPTFLKQLKNNVDLII
jgi:hypothetical protein